MAAGASSYKAFTCFYDVGREQSLMETARRHLVSLGGGQADHPGATLALANCYFQDDKDEAIRLFTLAAEGFARNREAVGEVVARHNLNILFRKKSPRDAENQVSRALRAADASSSPEAVTRAAVLEAGYLLYTGNDIGRAHRSLLRAKQAAFPSGDIGLRRTVLLLLANASSYLGKLDEAIAAAQAHQALRQEDGSTKDLSTMLLNELVFRVTRSEIDPRHGDRNRLVAAAEATLLSLGDLGDENDFARIEKILGDLLLVSDSKAARVHLNRCFERLREEPRQELECQCLWSMARALAASDPVRAEAMSRASIELARGVNDQSMEAFANQARLRLAWQTQPIESARETSLGALGAIERLRAAQREENARAEVFGAWTLDYRWLAGKLLSLSEPRLDEAFDVGERLRARVLLEGLDGQQPKLGAHFAKLPQISAALDPREALVWFSIAPEQDLYGDFGGGAWRLVVTRAGTTLTRLPDAAGLSDRVAAFSSLLSEREVDPAISSNAAAGLYTALFGPSFESLPRGIERLTIAADGPLPRLPFEALRARVEAPTLGERFEISTVPSATLWLRLRKGPSATFARPALVLADPLADKPLPWARREAGEIGGALGRETEIWLGSDASEARLTQADLAPFAALHFAVHAQANDAYPDRSAILLAREGGSDGHLEPREIAKLKLDGRVVVLSACDSASGALVSGEGFLSLARAFFQARARSVVAARWPIRDDDAKILFEHFYGALGRGETVGAALRAARRAAIEEGLPPQAWAGVVLLGDGEVRLSTEATENGGGRGWLALAVLGALLVFGAAAWARISALRTSIRQGS